MSRVVCSPGDVLMLLLFLVYCGVRTAKETGSAFACAAPLGIIVMCATEKAWRGFSDSTMITVIMHRTSEKTRRALSNNLSISIIMNGTTKHSGRTLSYNFSSLVVVDSGAKQTGFAHDFLCHCRSLHKNLVEAMLQLNNIRGYVQ